MLDLDEKTIDLGARYGISPRCRADLTSNNVLNKTAKVLLQVVAETPQVNEELQTVSEAIKMALQKRNGQEPEVHIYLKKEISEEPFSKIKLNNVVLTEERLRNHEVESLTMLVKTHYVGGKK